MSLVNLASTENVFLFVPNLIGYSRIVLALFSLWLMPSNYALAAFLYLLSGLLDALDGYAARRLGQGSRFGGMLDLITDMCNTMNLLTTLSNFYPNQRLLSFIAFITFPVALAKTAQALLQGYIAAIQLVEIDRKERKEGSNKE